MTFLGLLTSAQKGRKTNGLSCCVCRIRQSVETASANAAKEVARADALARAAQKARSARPGLKELERLKVPSAHCLSIPESELSTTHQ